MVHTSIPEWTSEGLIPPIPVLTPTNKNRSPYRVSLTDFVKRFALNSNRCKILNGFLRYRRELHNLGITSGFQWINGSFVENVELLENRHPNDLDVVSYYQIPPGESQFSLYNKNPSIFIKNDVKHNFHIDSYYVSLNSKPDILVEQSTYWYSMWSHRRNLVWKGYVQVDLSPSDDEAAEITLQELILQEC